MRTLEIIYWLRLALGIIAALLCTGYTGYSLGTGIKADSSTFMTGVSIALGTYLVSYYILKSKFLLKVEKPQKLVTTGIGIYFISWIAFWALLYTIITAFTA